MTHDHALPSACANCGASLDADPHPRFCPLCGQETELHPPSFGEFVHEFVGHYVALEGALWRTLGALLFHPGKLTREYLDGRRRRYVLPLRVYLSASFLFFLLVKFAGVGGAPVSFQGAPVAPGARSAAIQTDAGASTEMRDWIARCATPGACGWAETRLSRAAATLSGPQGTQAVGQRMGAAAPYAVFLMLPFFAALLQLAWRGRDGGALPYGAHFVFGLHLHAFAFLVLLAEAPLPESLSGWAVPLIFAYGVHAMRRVHGGGWVGTLARAALVGVAYALLLALGTAALAAGAILLSSGA